MESIPQTIGDFTVLPISIPPLPSYPKRVIHHVYLRPHAPKIPTEDDSRSIFLANVPVDSTEAHIRDVFTQLVGAGKFESISFESDRHAAPQTSQAIAPGKKRKRDATEAVAQLPPTWPRDLHRSGSTAVALLADEASVERVLKAVTKKHKTRKFPVWGEGVSNSKNAPAPLGAPWLRAHAKMSYPDSDALRQSMDKYAVEFNQAKQEAMELAKRLRNQPDADGFVTVSKGGRTAVAPTWKVSDDPQRLKEMEQKKKKISTGLANFYSFQAREKKKAAAAEILKGMEEDKKRAQAYKENKAKFRPEE